MSESIHLKGVSTHNLQNIDVSIPLGSITVVSGVSGSGKSSLVFDTLYGEAYRRYVESLSSFARQYLKTMVKPKIASVQNLPPSIAVKQKKGGSNYRSTVATLTELSELLPILFAHHATVICPGCKQEIIQHSPQTLWKKFLEKYEQGSSILITASLSEFKDMQPALLKQQLSEQGFSRVWLEGKLVKLQEVTTEQLLKCFVLIDRIKVDNEEKSRFITSVEQGFKLGKGLVSFIDPVKFDIQTYTSKLICLTCSKSFTSPNDALFSFNHPLGACPECQGFGRVQEISWDKVFPDKNTSIQQKGIPVFNFGDHESYYKEIYKSAKARDFDPKTLFSNYKEKDWEWLKNGDKKGAFSGITGYFKWLDGKSYKPHYRIHSRKFKKYKTCPVCEGLRFNENSRVFHLNGYNLSALYQLAIGDLHHWLETLSKLKFEHNRAHIGSEEAVEEALMRCKYMLKIGLGYLSLSRTSPTLSGGELQRIQMARCLGSALTSTLFCLDEPSSGLHAKDSSNLLQVLDELKKQGNTLVLVEHEKHIIENADYLIELGPKAGYLGGKITYSGPGKKHLVEPFPFTSSRVSPKSEFIHMEGVSTHNLKNCDVQIPLGAVTVVCGVSGSGKSSLIRHTLYPALVDYLGEEESQEDDESIDEKKLKKLSPKKALDKISDVLLVTQDPVGRTSRSNIATYLGIFDPIRKLFSELPQAQKLGLKPGAFSFNVPGGRCEICKGLGMVSEDLSFLGDMEVLCPGCQGKRFNENVLSVRFKKLSLLDILKLTIDEAQQIFIDYPAITKVLSEIQNLGLGYITLGQSTSSFSGGEAQRLKLASLLVENKNLQNNFLIFDEPTTGLADEDIKLFLDQVKGITARGNTVVIVEHHLGVIRQADWLIEIGPKASAEGGTVVFQGIPREIKHVAISPTGKFL